MVVVERVSIDAIHSDESVTNPLWVSALFNILEMSRENVIIRDGVQIRLVKVMSNDVLVNSISSSSSVTSFFENDGVVDGSVNNKPADRFVDGSESGVEKLVSLNGIGKDVKKFDEAKVEHKLVYRRYISPRDEVMKIAVGGAQNGAGNGSVIASFTKQLMREVSQAQKDKRSINIGLIYCNSYYGTANDLGDCAINDGLLTYDSLTAYGFKCFLFYDCLKDDCLKSLTSVIKSPSIDQVCVYFIGHGTRSRDVTGDESDGYDELFVFRDGMIRDDRIAEDIVKAYPINMPKKRLLLISDCCHSGTIFDTETILKSSKGIPVISVSACQDTETAKQEWFGFGVSQVGSLNGSLNGSVNVNTPTNTVQPSRIYKGNGVFSHYFWKAIRDNGDQFAYDIEWNTLMESVNRKIRLWGMRGAVRGKVQK